MTAVDVEQAIAGVARAWAEEHLGTALWVKVSAFGRGEIEIRSKEVEAAGEATILALWFSHARRHVYLTNIFLPQTLRRGGIGKALIDAIRAAAGADGYSLFATGLVPNFYERLVRRGAVIVTVDDAVLITPETDLTNHYQ